MITTRRFCALLVCSAALAIAPSFAATSAPELRLSEPPGSLAPSTRDGFRQTFTDLRKQWSQVVADRAAFHAEFGRSISKDSPRASEAQQRRNAVQQRAAAIRSGAANYHKQLRAALDERKADLDRQIDELVENLRNNHQFEGAVEEFERLHQEGEKARAEMIGGLLERLQDLIAKKATGALKAEVLGRLKSLSPEKVNEFKDRLAAAGLARPELVGVLERMAANKTGPQLAEDAPKVFRLIEREKALFEFSKTYEGDVAAQQQAALHLLTMLFDWPVLGEAKIIAHAAYQAGEGISLAVMFNRSADSLAQTTEAGLEAQKVIAQRLKTLFDQKKAVDADLAALPL